MAIDQISDLLTRIRNASRAGHASVKMPTSLMKERVLEVLKAQGYIHHFERTTDATGKGQLKISLRYGNTGQPAIREINRLSKPGRREYIQSGDISRFKSGLGTVVLSTSQGVMSGTDAASRGIGGELICSVF